MSDGAWRPSSGSVRIVSHAGHNTEMPPSSSISATTDAAAAVMTVVVRMRYEDNEW